MSITNREENIYSQPGRDEILAWIEDGPDCCLDNHTNGEEIRDDTKPSKDFPRHSDDLCINQLEPGTDDIFFSSRMPTKVHWSVPWSDLMMTMFILFVVMYIYHSSKKEFLASDGLETKSTIERADNAFKSDEKTSYDYQSTLPKLYDLSKQTLQAKNLNNFASVDLVTDKAVRIILTGDLLFKGGKAELMTGAKEKLKDIAPLIKKTPYKINVVGHTDNLPINSPVFPTNWELSVIRACVVARFFIEEMGINGSKFYLSGHSYFQPVRPNSTSQNRATNRRVEIIITKERPYGMPMANNPLTLESYENEILVSAAHG